MYTGNIKETLNISIIEEPLKPVTNASFCNL
jgi:hypothetical protein